MATPGAAGEPAVVESSMGLLHLSELLRPRREQRRTPRFAASALVFAAGALLCGVFQHLAEEKGWGRGGRSGAAVLDTGFGLPAGSSLSKEDLLQPDDSPLPDGFAAAESAAGKEGTQRPSGEQPQPQPQLQPQLQARSGAGGQEHPAPEERPVASARSTQQRRWRAPGAHRAARSREKAARGRSRFVTAAFDAPGAPDVYLNGALALARMIQRKSRVGLLVLANNTHFSDGTDVAEAFAALGAEVRPLRAVPLLRGPDASEAGGAGGLKEDAAFWRLQAWNLTEHELVVWLDADVALYRPVDWLFERPGMWAQRGDWWCSASSDLVGLHTGVLSLRPNASDYLGLLSFARSAVQPGAWSVHELIRRYFAEVRQLQIRPLLELEAAFGQCLGVAESPYVSFEGRNLDVTVNVRGQWSASNLVHSSGGLRRGGEKDGYANICFAADTALQLYKLADNPNETANACHAFPLGAYWRDNFCDAAWRVGLKGRTVSRFCNDLCYYHGLKARDSCGSGSSAAAEWLPHAGVMLGIGSAERSLVGTQGWDCMVQAQCGDADVAPDVQPADAGGPAPG